MVTTSDIDYDSRILNEADSLSKNFKVIIFSRKYLHQNIIKSRYFQIKRIDYHRFGFFQLNIFSSFFSLIKAVFSEDPDVYHAHDLDGLLCAFPAALFKRKTLVYDSHEIWSGTYPFKNLRGIQWLLPLLEKILIWRIEKGVTVNSSIADYLTKKYHKNFIALYNTPKLVEKNKKYLNLNKKFPNKKIILHLGAADEGRGMEQIIEATKYLPKNYILVFMGGGKIENELKQIIKETDLRKRVIFLPAVPQEQIQETIKYADLGLALTEKVSLSYYLSLPNKIFQYIAAEVPILGSNFPEYKKIILREQIGRVVDPSRPKLIAQKITEMIKKDQQKKFHQNLEGLAKEKYNWNIEAKKLLKF